KFAFFLVLLAPALALKGRLRRSAKAQCTSPVHAVDGGYVVYEASKMAHSFNVTAKCASDYKGIASVSRCKTAGTPYSLTGCVPETCAPPSDGKGYELKAFSIDRPSFSVSVKCSSGIGHGRAKVCTKDGEPYTLEGCYIGQCSSPVGNAAQGYVVYEGSKMPHSFHVTASCAAGYRGTASVSACKDADAPYSLTGCEPEACTEPSSTETEGYELKVHSLQRPSFSVSVRCKSGIGFGKAKECTKDGEPYTLEGCYMGECTSPANLADHGYVVYEGSRMPHTFDVRATCAVGYKGTPEVKACDTTQQPYLLTGCSTESCVEPSVVDQANYEVDIHSLSRPFFRVTAKCKHGFGTAKVKECHKDGDPFELEGCMDACASPKKAAEAGYVVFEEKLVMNEFSVSASCADGYKGTATVGKCGAANEPYILTGCSPVTCAEPSAADKAAYALTVHSADLPSFNIVANCKNGVGTAKARACTEDGQPFVLEGCPSLCISPKKTVEHGYTVLEKSLLMSDFEAHAVCADGYTGVAAVAKCAAPNEPYSLSGCSPAKCAEPSNAAAYDLTVFSVEVPSFSVVAKCKNGVGTGRSKACSKEGEPFVLEGCPSMCSSPKRTSEDGYVVFEKSLLFDDFTAHAVCADGYTGKASVGKCSAVSLPYTLGGCAPAKCVEPTGAEMFNYNIAVNSLYLPTFSVTATCRNGSGRGKALPCQGDRLPYKLEVVAWPSSAGISCAKHDAASNAAPGWIEMSSGADAGAGVPPTAPAAAVPAPPHETQTVATASAPQSLPALPEEAEAGDGRREESDLLQYSQTLGIDLTQHSDLLWVVQEAFNAPLPLSWTEYTDDEGRVYFFNQSSSQSTWEHPMDAVYRELLTSLALVASLDAMGSAASTSLKSAAAGATDQELAAALSQLNAADLQKLKSAVAGRQRVVVVGWGPVGHAVVAKLLAKSGALQVVVISEENYPAYNRVKLTTFFEHRDPNQLALSSVEWCQSNGVELLLGKATKIDRAAKSVEYTTPKGEVKSTAYDQLVLATGSKPWLPPVPGLSLDVPGVHVYRTIDDLFQVTERAKNAKAAAVIGGGLLGLEAAKAAYDLKLETYVLEVAPGLMPVQLDAEAGAMLKGKIESLGLKVHTGVKVLEVLTGDGGLQGVKIEVGGKEQVLDVQLLIVGAGVRPRQELAEASGLELGGRGGVKTDHTMRSVTDEHVWAVGEIASYNGGMCYQLSAPGYTQAEVLADHLTNPGADSKFMDADLSTKLKLLGVDVASFGGSSDFWFKRQYTSTDPEQVQTTVAKDEASGCYKKLVFTADGTKLLGGILVGDISDFASLTAVSKRADIGGLTPEDLMAGKMPKVDDGGDGTNLGDEDLVCNCHSVPKKVIRDAIKNGAHTFEDIKKCTKAGTGCGTCIRTGPQPKLLSHTLNSLGVEKGCCKSLPFEADDIEDLAKARQLKTYEELVSNLGYPPAAVEGDKAALAGVLDRIGGKPKGEGMDHAGQLKALKEDLWKFVDKMNCNPILLRLAWHDAGTYDKSKSDFGDRGGANGSIRFSPEITMGANNGLDKAVKYLEPFKADYPLVSYADLYQMAAAVSIQHAGGPEIEMKYGRKDATGPEACPGRQSRGTADNAGLPDAEPGPEGKFGCGATDAASHLRNIFYRMGFDDKGIVALSGAHTIGRAFKERSGTVKEGYGESNGCPYTRALPASCPIRHDGKGGVGMPGGKSWTSKWLKFDNEYFQPSVYEEKDANLLWLSSDRCLHQDESFKKYFMQYRDDQAAFFKDFAEAYKQLSEQGAEFEPAGGISI
ncbi:nasB, partial [Symbiodinium sp. KB8]